MESVAPMSVDAICWSVASFAMHPRVTVIIATFNWSEVLPYSIGSVLRQTFSDFELLVVGDGCTDDSERIVHAIGDPRVRWINLPDNTGHQSGPNNEGLRQARGEIIAYLGHDDLWLPHHLAAHVAALESTGSDVAYSLCLLVSADETSCWPAVPKPRAGSYAPPTCMTHRRCATEDAGGWRDHRTLDESRDVSPDVELWRRLHAAGSVFTFVPRLSGIKFPASWRRDVYRTRPSHEQAHWLARVAAEPDLEARLLVNCVASEEAPTGLEYRELLRHVVKQTVGRVRRRFALPAILVRKARFGRDRHFKGL
jgi:glycosyltransferase involved in cell wall biosynthesis